MDPICLRAFTENCREDSDGNTRYAPDDLVELIPFDPVEEFCKSAICTDEYFETAYSDLLAPVDIHVVSITPDMCSQILSGESRTGFASVYGRDDPNIACSHAPALEDILLAMAETMCFSTGTSCDQIILLMQRIYGDKSGFACGPDGADPRCECPPNMFCLGPGGELGAETQETDTPPPADQEKQETSENGEDSCTDRSSPPCDDGTEADDCSRFGGPPCDPEKTAVWNEAEFQAEVANREAADTDDVVKVRVIRDTETDDIVGTTTYRFSDGKTIMIYVVYDREGNLFEAGRTNADGEETNDLSESIERLRRAYRESQGQPVVPIPPLR